MESESDPPINPYAAPSDPDVADRPAISTSSIIFWIVTLSLVGMLLFFAPGFAILGTIVLLPPLVRTTIVLSRRVRDGSTLTFAERSLVLFSSVGGMLVAVVASIAAFYAVCGIGFFIASPSRSFGEFGVLVWLVLGITIPVVTGMLILRLLWKSK